MTVEWPSEPPQPTDLDQSLDGLDLPAKHCPYCGEVIDLTGDGYPYADHSSDCHSESPLTPRFLPRGFYLVIPGEDGGIWETSTGGFACRRVVLRGDLIPLELRKGGDVMDSSRREELESRFADWPDSEKALDIYLRGLEADSTETYGGFDLGERLVSERLAGVYDDDDKYRAQMRETRTDRIQNVWEMIDEELPFTYERVAAPRGYPLTREGLRWVDVTGRNGWTADDIRLESMYGWVADLIGRDSPVALVYPNCD